MLENIRPEHLYACRVEYKVEGQIADSHENKKQIPKNSKMDLLDNFSKNEYFIEKYNKRQLVMH